jgi:hypothetical protein
MDLVFGIHLIGVRVFLGDGKGNFKDGSLGMEATDFTTRRVTTADVDLDGDTDIVALFEGPAPMREGSKKFEGGKLRIYRNDGKAGKWTIVDASAPADYVGGDWLAVGKFNDDRYPDFVGSSNFYQATDVLYRSTGAGKWAKVDSRDGQLIPFLSLYNAVTAARLSSKKLDDAVLSFQRTWPEAIDASVIRKPSLSFVVGLDRVVFDGGTPKRVPLVRYDSKRPITGLAAGDFDGDGNRDLIFTKFDPREFIVLLGDGKGNFRQAALEGITAANNANYDITVADVNKDGRPDVLVMYESSAASSLGRQDGSIRVFLNRGVAPAGPQTADAKK